MNTVTSRDAGAADELALAQLDNDGAPPAATWPQISDGQDHHAIRRGPHREGSWPAGATIASQP